MQPRGGSCSPEEGVTHLVSRGKLISKEKFMPKEELGNHFTSDLKLKRKKHVL